MSSSLLNPNPVLTTGRTPAPPRQITQSQSINDLALRSRPHRLSSSTSSPNLTTSEPSSRNSVAWSDDSFNSDSEAPSTPATDLLADGASFEHKNHDVAAVDLTQTHKKQVTTTLVTQDPDLLRDAAGDPESRTRLIQKFCCGGGCCFLKNQPPPPASSTFTPIEVPQNEAYESLNLKLGALGMETELTSLANLPAVTVTISPIPSHAVSQQHQTTVQRQPPTFVQPHPPYDVYSAPLHHARELTKPGAEKRTFHFDVDVTDYPEEGDVDFKVGGAVGVSPPNHPEAVNELFDILGVPSFARDKPVLLKTKSGRWPTIWGDDHARELVTTRREILTWCSDIQSYPPTKPLLRLLAEHASHPVEKKILLYLSSAEGQGSFCDLRTGPHLSMSQLLHAFPSSKPPLPNILSSLNQLMPRFYSLSNDPHISSDREGLAGRRLIEIAVTVHETPHWRGGPRTGVGSGFLERQALAFINAEIQPGGSISAAQALDLRIPMFRGLMANPLSKQFQDTSDGPMMLIGAGVGMAPFRGFILNRLRNANCASKIWLVQGVRDAEVDELYSGELGKYEKQIKKVVQSRAGSAAAKRKHHHGHSHQKHNHSNKPHDSTTTATSEPTKDLSVLSKAGANLAATHATKTEARYVQDEVRAQADIVWDVINSVDGRVFVCGSSKGMGEGVEEALCQVAVSKGGLTEAAAKAFWEEMKGRGKYIAETW